LSFVASPIVLRHGDTLICTRRHPVATVTQPIHHGEMPTRRKLALMEQWWATDIDETLTSRCGRCDGVWWRWGGGVNRFPEFHTLKGWTAA